MASEVSCRVRVIGSPYEKDKLIITKMIIICTITICLLRLAPELVPPYLILRGFSLIIRNYIVDCLLMSIIVVTHKSNAIKFLIELVNFIIEYLNVFII